MSGWTQPVSSNSSCSDMSLDKLDTDLLTRTSWVDAGLAYRQVKRGKAKGNKCSLLIRKHLQKHFFSIGNFVQRHSAKVLIIGLLILCLCAVGLKNLRLETSMENLWVADGGRLEAELNYTRTMLGVGYGVLSPVIIQSPLSLDKSVLTKESMTVHLQALMEATMIKVNLYDMVWRFEDICFKASFATFENNVIDQILSKLLPCVIITPLDCFWEGSKLLGPSTPIRLQSMTGLDPLTWSNLDPQGLIEVLKKRLNMDADLDYAAEVLFKAGVTSGYQSKPCLDPHDPGCPPKASNYGSNQSVDVGAELTGGCSGFATRYMQWTEDLIVGGVKRDRSGRVVYARALQSVLHLMGEQELYEYYENDVRVSSIGWSVDKAAKLLEVWQRKFTDRMLIVAANATSLTSPVPSGIATFTELSLEDMLVDFSSISYVRIGIGYGLMLVYACVALLRYDDAAQSQSGVGMTGVVLVALSVTAGLGFCSVLQIASNAATTQVIPFLALGMGVSDMLQIAHAFSESSKWSWVAYEHLTGEVLKRIGFTVVSTSVCNMCCVFLGALLPVPALRSFALQLGLLLLFNLLTLLLLFTAACSIDLWRRREKRIDVFCCLEAARPTVDIVHPLCVGDATAERLDTEPSECPAPPPYGVNGSTKAARGRDSVALDGGDGCTTTALAPPDYDAAVTSLPSSACNSRQNLTGGGGVRASCYRRCARTRRECCSFTLLVFTKKHYVPFMQKASTKGCVVFVCLATLGLGVYGAMCIEDGMDLSEIVPRNTNEYNFLEMQSQYFGFYNMYIVTKADFDYANRGNQRLLRQLHSSISTVSSVMRNTNGSLPDFWLDVFVQWLQGLQQAVDTDMARGCFSRSKGSYSNASADGAIGYMLLAQTGDPDDPIDYSRAFRNIRLVDGDGYVRADGFYNYLTAWSNNDVTAYDLSQANLRPIPQGWYYVPQDKDPKIPRSQNIVYAQMAFYLNNLGSDASIIKTIEDVRSICDAFAAKGVPNYPAGVPFTYWEQYTNLRSRLALLLGLTLVAVLALVGVATGSMWGAVLVTATLAITLVELLGFMGLVGLHLSAVPAAVLVVAVGASIPFGAHVSVAFVTSVGGRDLRTSRALEHVMPPVVRGAIAVVLSLAMLFGSDFDFIIRYFLYTLLALVALGTLNGLALLPVLLSILGPPADISPLDPLASSISPPTPDASPKQPRKRPSKQKLRSNRGYPRIPSEISLSTISEEPSQLSSHEIVVEPTVQVETRTTAPASNTSTSVVEQVHPGTSSRGGVTTTTTIRATTTVKVEVHTCLPGSVSDSEHQYKRKKRKPRDSDYSSDSDESQV